MSTARVSYYGRITIPISVRRKLGLKPGDRIEFVQISELEFLVLPSATDVRLLKGLLNKPKKPVSIDDMRNAIRNRRSRK